MDNGDSLLCEEDGVASPWSDSENGRSLCSLYSCPDDQQNPPTGLFSTFLLDEGEAVACLVDKEPIFMPENGYLAALKSQGICDARSTAVQWILKVKKSYSFSAVTVSLAVNYFDRYLSKHLSKPWKAWMVQLLSVACLSVAAKMEEIDVPPLLGLQIDGMEHFFEAKTIQRMELAVLGSLGWRMSSVTVFSYVDELLYRLDLNDRLRKSLAIRIRELLLGSLSEADFLEFRPYIITLSAVSCALEEVAPLHAESLINILLKLFPLSEVRVELEKCSRSMEELVVDPVCTLASFSQVFGNPSSPVTVAQVSQKENVCGEAARNYSNQACSRICEDVPVARCSSSRKRKLDSNK